MPKTKTEDLSRPSIEVKIPQVRLQLKDLAFLRSLAQPDAVHCHVPGNVMDRLRFLDLIARANVPPTANAIHEVEKEEAKMLVELRKEIEDKNWSRAEQTCRTLRYARERLVAKPKDVLTPKGEQILRTGEVVVRVRKVGCV
jgi:phage terminase large subunit-like protein